MNDRGWIWWRRGRRKREQLSHFKHSKKSGGYLKGLLFNVSDLQSTG
jgi:hypothetical protein